MQGLDARPPRVRVACVSLPSFVPALLARFASGGEAQPDGSSVGHRALGHVALRLLLALFPLLLTPALGFLLVEGYLDLGGGEKDVVWLLPWALWSVLYGTSSGILWARHWPWQRALPRSVALATGGVFLAGLGLALMGELGACGDVLPHAWRP